MAAYPLVSDQLCRARLAEVLLATEGVTLGREAAEALSEAHTDRAADLLTKPSKDRPVAIRRERVAWRHVGAQEVVELRVHPTFIPSPRNLRIAVRDLRSALERLPHDLGVRLGGQRAGRW